MANEMLNQRTEPLLVITFRNLAMWRIKEAKRIGLSLILQVQDHH
jgi:hypothetical protein